jgi:hypothetical protein
MKTKETVNVANTDIELNGQNFQKVDTFKYLGSIITSRKKKEYNIKGKTAALNKVLNKMYISESTNVYNCHKTNYNIRL